MQTEYDITLIGGGLVGLSCALALAPTRLRIACVDKQPLLSDAIRIQDSYDARVFAITRQSERFLRTLKVWPLITMQRTAPYRTMHVWDQSGTGDIHFNCQEVGEPNLGHIIENHVLVYALQQQLAACDNVDLLTPVQLQSMQRNEDGWELHTTTDARWTSRLIIGADGAHSWVREQAGIALRSWDYQHHALVATVKTERTHGQCARQCFMPRGPLAFLPLEDDYHCSIVWSSEPEHIAELKQLPEAAFNEEMTTAFYAYLGKCTVASERFSFPLRMRHATDYVQTGLALIGDAAHTIHPLAGQGANLGLADAECLAHVITQLVDQKRDIAESLYLSRYARQRKGHNWVMIAAMEGFKRLFGDADPSLIRLRNQGLRWTNRFLPGKRLLIRKALGLV